MRADYDVKDIAVLGFAAVALAGWLWWDYKTTQQSKGRATAISASAGGSVTIKGGLFTVNGKKIHVPDGTYTDGIVADETGVRWPESASMRNRSERFRPFVFEHHAFASPTPR